MLLYINKKLHVQLYGLLIVQHIQFCETASSLPFEIVKFNISKFKYYLHKKIF